MDKTREWIRRVMVAVNCIDGLYDAAAKQSDVKANTLYLLYALDDGLPHTQKDICQTWLLPPTTLNTIVKECEGAGYLTLRRVAGRKRDLEICLTPSGQAFAQETLGPIYQAEARALAQTLQTRGPEFVEGLESFCGYLKRELGGLSENSEAKK